MFKFLIAVIAGYILFRLFANEAKKRKNFSSPSANSEENNYSDAREMVEDPVCGVYVSPELSPAVRDGDKVYYFCSYECRDKFLESRGGSAFSKSAGP